MIIVFSYQRPKRLLTLLKGLDEHCYVIDDGSDYDPSEHRKYAEYHRYKHQGKEGFWRLWDEALKLCRDSEDDWFLFLQDDVEDVQLDKIREVTKGLDKYAFNIMRRGNPLRGWTAVTPKETKLNGLDVFECGYVDCIYVTNRKTLELLDWKMEPLHPYRVYQKGRSSGVGEQQSQRFVELGVPMYFPKVSLAFHGDHPSKMHPDRKINHMISK